MSITAPLHPEAPSGDPARARKAALVDHLAALSRAEARRFVDEGRMLVELQFLAGADDPMGWPVWAAEAALAQSVSEGSLRARADRARRLVALPPLCDALVGGRVGVAHALRLLDTLAEAPPPVAVPAVEHALAALATATLSPAELAERARRAWYRHDADAIARSRQAGLARRGVWFRHLGQPGVSQFGGTGAAEEALAAEQRLRAAARAGSDSCDNRTVAQREADLALVLLTHGQLPGQSLPAASTQLVIHVPAQTLTGKSDEPAVLAGAGLIDAHHARELARTGDLVPAGTDPGSGAVVSRHEGLVVKSTRGARPRTGREVADLVAGWVRLFRATSSSSDGLEARTFGVHIHEAQYRPSAGLERFVRSRFTTCVAPTSSSWRTDVEHPVAWPGGATAGRHLTLLSRHWHRLKQAGFGYRPNPDASTTWTTPLGRTYRSAPSFEPPLLRATARDPDAPAPGPPDWAPLEPRPD